RRTSRAGRGRRSPHPRRRGSGGSATFRPASLSTALSRTVVAPAGEAARPAAAGGPGRSVEPRRPPDRARGTVDVADRDRNGVGRVVRRRGGRQPEQRLHHLSHLRLLGAAEADDRAFDLRRRVLDDRDARRRRGEQRDAARVAEAQRAPDVLRVEDVLDGDAVRPVLGDEIGETRMDDEEAIGKQAARRSGRTTEGGEPVRPAAPPAPPVPRTPATGTNPEILPYTRPP